MRIDIAIIVRILGLIALLWTNWQVAVIAMIVLAFTPMPKGDQARTIKYVLCYTVRIIVEIGAYALALIGIWDFPLIDSGIAHILVYLAVVLSVLSFVINLRRELREDYNEKCIKYLKYYPLEPK